MEMINSKSGKTLGKFCTMTLSFYYWFWTGKYRLGWLYKMRDLCYFQVNLLVPLFRPLILRVMFFFSIFQFNGDTVLFSVTIVKQTYKRKKQLSKSKVFWCFQWVEKGCTGNEWVKTKALKFLSTDILVSLLIPFSKYKNRYMLYLQCYLKNSFDGDHD